MTVGEIICFGMLWVICFMGFLFAMFGMSFVILDMFDLWEPFKNAVREWILRACKGEPN